MKQKLPSLFFGAMSIICACIIVALAPVYVSDVCDLYGHLTFTDIDWGLTAWNTLAFSAATFLMLIDMCCGCRNRCNPRMQEMGR